jgi:hypothetical protein
LLSEVAVLSFIGSDHCRKKLSGKTQGYMESCETQDENPASVGMVAKLIEKVK